MHLESVTDSITLPEEITKLLTLGSLLTLSIKVLVAGKIKNEAELERKKMCETSSFPQTMTLIF